MQKSSTALNTPWAGIAALAAASVVAGLLVGPVSWANLLQTWYLTRAAGLVAYVLLWASVSLGLLQSIGLLKGVTSPLANVDMHSFFSLGAIYATVYHAVILLWDRHMPFTWTDLLVPFAVGHDPILVGLGSLSFYIALGAVVTTYLRGKLTPRLWRSIHLFSLVSFFLALAHGARLGTDTELAAVGYLYRFTGISVAFLLLCRVYKGVWGNANPTRGG